MSRHPGFVGRSLSTLWAVLAAVLMLLHAPPVESSRALAVLTEVGEISALKGSVAYHSGHLYAIERGHAYSHRAPQRPTPLPTAARVVASQEVCSASTGKREPAQLGWGIVARASGSVGSVARAEIVLRRGPAGPGLLPYAPLELQIRSEGEVIARMELEPVVFPCEIIIDDFTPAPGNEVALTWLSIAAGYSAGATIFEVSR